MVEAKDKKEAKRKLLSAAATYGSLESQGLYEFMQDAEIAMDELVEDFNFSEIDFPDFQKEFFEEIKPGTEDEQGKLDELQMVIMECPHCKETFEKRQAKVIS